MEFGSLGTWVTNNTFTNARVEGKLVSAPAWRTRNDVQILGGAMAENSSVKSIKRILQIKKKQFGAGDLNNRTCFRF